MNGLYLASSMAAAVYLLWVIGRLKSRVCLPALVLALMLAVHVSRILWVVVTHKVCDGWDVAFNAAYAALAFVFVCVFKMQRRI